MKWSPEDRDNLRELIDHAGFKLLIQLIEEQCEGLEADVLKLSMDTTDIKILLQKKLKAEGARQLLSNVTRRVASLKAKQ